MSDAFELIAFASEDQARRIAEARITGDEGNDFKIMWHENRRTKLTLFGILVTATGQYITHQ